MRAVLTIFKREFWAYANSAIGYVYVVAFLAVCGALFVAFYFDTESVSLRQFFENLPWVLVGFVPAITMRLWAEERKLGTAEVLLTLPVTGAQAVLGKFLASYAFLLLGLVLTFPLVIVVAATGSPDWGPITGGYVGMFLLTGVFLAIGAMFSSLTANQIVAWILATLACAVLFAPGYEPVINFIGQQTRLGWEVAYYMSIATHFNDIAKGVIDLKALVYCGTMMGLFLYLNIVAVEWRKL